MFRDHRNHPGSPVAEPAVNKRMLFRALRLSVLVLGCMAAAMATEHEPVRGDSTIAEHMRMHFTAARAIRAFVIAGQMDGVPGSAEWLIMHETPAGLPGDWEPYVEDMRKYAKKALYSGHLVFAAEALGEMARTCGECHAANGVSVVLEDDTPPPEADDKIQTRMRRHLWAADRMWEGLIAPSDLEWNRGAAMLAETYLDAANFEVTAEQAPSLAYLLNRKRQIGVEGLTAKTGTARSALYGEFLAMCGDCHQLIGRGPQPPRTVVPAGE